MGAAAVALGQIFAQGRVHKDTHTQQNDEQADKHRSIRFIGQSVLAGLLFNGEGEQASHNDHHAQRGQADGADATGFRQLDAGLILYANGVVIGSIRGRTNGVYRGLERSIFAADADGDLNGFLQLVIAVGSLDLVQVVSNRLPDL